MPNHVTNILTVSGDPKRMAELFEAIKTEQYGLGSIDFAKIILMIFILILMGYAVIKVFFANLKRGGILLIQIAVGSLYMFSIPRGYIDGFVSWSKQVIGLCLTIGTESGDNTTLALANKGYTADDIIEQCKKLDEAGIEYYFVYMTGLAGKGGGFRNAINSADVFNQLNPYFISVDSLTLFPDTKLYAMAQRGEFVPADEKERIEELQTFVNRLQLRTHIFANSKSNFYPTYAYLPNEREKIISELQYALDTVSEEEMVAYRAGLNTLG